MREFAPRGARLWRAASAVVVAGLFLAACAPPPVQPTTAPAAQPTPAAKVGPSPSPAAQPAASPAASPAAKPTASPAARPAASPVASPGAAALGKPLEPMTPPSGAVSDTITVSMGQNPDTLHPLIGSMMARSEVLAGLLTPGVLNDNRGEWVAIGVEQVPTLENGGAQFVGQGDDRHLEVTFKIRQGLTWHDGRPTTSKDVKYAWELVMNPRFPATARDLSIKISDVATPDDRTAVVKYMSAKQARDAAANGFKGLEAALWADYKDVRDALVDPLYFSAPTGETFGWWLPEHILGQIAPDQHQASEWARNPVGNGPYRLVEWVPDQHLRLQALDSYILGKPVTRNIVFRIIPDTNAQLAALQAGEIDVATQVQGPDVDRSPELDRLQGYKPFYIPGTPWEHIDLLTTDPALTDKNVRKALIMGINRQEIVDRLLFGKTRVATSWAQPGIPAWAYDESCLTQYRYDPDGARRLLQQAGQSSVRLRLQTTDAALRRNVAQVVQANLRQIGVDLELEFLPARSFFGTEGPLTRAQYQLGMYTWLSAPDPDATTLYHSRAIPTQENNWVGQNYPRYNNPRFDELMTRGASELDTQRRKQIYCDAQRMWTDDVPVIPLFQRLVVTVARTTMGNYRPTPTLTPETWNLWAWYVPAR